MQVWSNGDRRHSNWTTFVSESLFNSHATERNTAILRSHISAFYHQKSPHVGSVIGIAEMHRWDCTKLRAYLNVTRQRPASIAIQIGSRYLSLDDDDDDNVLPSNRQFACHIQQKQSSVNDDDDHGDKDGDTANG